MLLSNGVPASVPPEEVHLRALPAVRRGLRVTQGSRSRGEAGPRTGTRSGGAQEAVSCPDFHLKVLPLHFSYRGK